MSGFKSYRGFAFFFIFASFLFAQQTHNLEVIWTIPGNPNLYACGFNLASGDIDNDGRSDILVSADTFVEEGGHRPYRGRVYLYYGNNIGDTIPDVVFKSPFVKGTTPTRVHSADLNGDNFDDIIIGEEQADEGAGTVTIFLGGNPIDTIPDFILRGRSVLGLFFGCDVSSGDVNGDGFRDLIVGAYGTDPIPGYPFMGRTYIYFGGPNFNTVPDVLLNGGHQGQREGFGCTVGSGGDVNSDGFEDVIVGAPDFSSGSFWGEGRIYIYYGGDPMDTVYDVAMTGEVPNLNLGWTPKVNLLKTELEYDMATFGSGFWPYGFPREGPGKVYVLFGGNPMDSIPDVWMIGRTETTSLGRRVSNAGFVNQIGSEGIVSGAPVEYGLIGSAYLWLGGALLDTTPDAWIRGIQYDDGIGWYVASAGDVDCDGKDEIMVSNYASNYTPKRVWVCKYTGLGIEEENRYPHTVLRLLLEVYPNPVKSVLCVRCPLSAKELKIYDISGKLVKRLEARSKKQEVGNYEIRWDLKDEHKKRVANGIYFIEVTTENEKIKEIRKVIVTK